MPSKSTVKHHLTIESAERLNNSRSGNPRFRLYLVPANGGLGFSAITQSDASCNYGVTNYLANWRKPATLLTVRFTPAGRVSHLIPETETNE